MKIRKHRRLLSLLYALGVIALVALPALITAAAEPPLGAATSPGRDGQGMIIRGMQGMATTVRDRLQLMALAWPDLLRFPALLSNMLTDDGRVPLHIVLLRIALVFTVGVVAEVAFRRILSRAGRIAHDRTQETLRQRLTGAALRLLVDGLAVGVFALGCTAAYFATDRLPQPAQAVLIGLFNAVVIVRLVATAGCSLLSPDRPTLRLLPLADADARYLASRLVSLTLLITLGGLVSELASALALGEGLWLLLGLAAMTFVFAALALIVWHDRAQLSRLLAAPPVSKPSNAGTLASRTQDALTGHLHILAITVLVLVWAAAVYARLATGGLVLWPVVTTLVLIITLLAVNALLGLGVDRFLTTPQQAKGPASDGGRAGATTLPADKAESVAEACAPTDYSTVIVRNLRIALSVLGLLLLGRIWNIDLERIIGASMGQRLAEAVFTIIVTLILASVAWGLVKAAIRRHAPDKGFDISKLEEAEGGGGVASRVQTITVLFGRFVLVTLVVIATLIVLSSLGINIGPLLAGAGVVGLAIGFGAQTLVRDIITGVFLLLEDAFRVGEYVDVGIARGTVESVSVRSMRLRHHLGPIHTVPFGAINNLTNYSRDWAIMKLDLRLPFDTDLEKVRKLVKRLGQEMLADASFRDSFLQPLKSQGATRMDDDAFIVRVKFMARPGEQFVLRREVFRRIQEAFQKNGIRFAPRRVIVDTIGGNSSADDRAAAAAFATQTLQREPKITASDDSR